MRSNGQYISIQNVNIHYYEEGQGTPVVFLHGIGQSIFTFRKNIQALTDQARVIALDLPGHGQSDKPDIRYTIRELADYVHWFLEAMELTKVTLVGFSTGGVIAMDLAIRYPDDVGKLILLIPGGLTKTCPGYLKALTIPIINDALFTFYNKHMVRSVLESAYYDLTVLTSEVQRNYYKTLLDKGNRDAMIQALNHWDDSEIAYELANLQIHIHILGGTGPWHSSSGVVRGSHSQPYVPAEFWAYAMRRYRKINKNPGYTRKGDLEVPMRTFFFCFFSLFRSAIGKGRRGINT